MLIRQLRRPDDIASVIDVFRASVRKIASRDYGPEQILAWAPDEIDPLQWATRYDTRLAWVADIGGALAGFIELEDQAHGGGHGQEHGHQQGEGHTDGHGQQHREGHLDMLYVHPAQQRVGIATALLRQLEDAARGQGIDQLRTEASLTARPFFERRGFRVIAPQTVTHRGQQFINFRMAKVLERP